MDEGNVVALTPPTEPLIDDPMMLRSIIGIALASHGVEQDVVGLPDRVVIRVNGLQAAVDVLEILKRVTSGVIWELAEKYGAEIGREPRDVLLDLLAGN